MKSESPAPKDQAITHTNDSSGQPASTPETVGAHLEWLFGDLPHDEWLTQFAINRKTGEKVTRWYLNTVEGRDAFTVDSQDLTSTGSCVWFGCATRKPDTDRSRGKRGTAEDCATVPGFWADIDIEDGTGAHSGNKTLARDVAEALDVLNRFPVPASVVLNSGHGLQAWWKFAEPRPADQAELDTWRDTWAAIGAEAACHVDNVFDLPRVMRLPGTLNHKTDPPVGVRVINDDGAPVAFDVLAEHFRPAPTVPQPTAKTARHGDRLDDGDRPGDIYARTVSAAEVLERNGWLHHRSDSTGEHWTRPGKDPRLGSSAKIYPDGKAVTWTDATELEPRSSLNSFQLMALLEFDGEFSAAAKAAHAQGHHAPQPSSRGHGRDATGEPGGTETDPGRFFEGRDGLDHLKLKAAVLELGPIVAGPGATLWWYRDGVYVQGGEAEAKRRVEALLGKRFRRTHGQQIVESLQIQVPFIGDQHPPNYINCRNGLLHWPTGELEPHTPDVPTTYQLAVNWDPQATCLHVEQWMAEVVDVETVALLWEVIGVSVRSDMPYHRAVLLYGHGRNGKGTFLRIIEKLIGREFISAVTLQSLGEDRFAGADLFGKVANISGDLDARHIKRTDLFKMATGGDTIRAERKYGQSFSFVNHATMLFSANELPGTSDHTHGFFDRWIIVPFTGDFRGREDRCIETKLHSELEGVLVLAVGALQRLEERGQFTLPTSVKKATEEYRTEADPVRSFAEEQLVFDQDARQNRTDLYKGFRFWCEDNGRQAPAATKFYRRLAQLDAIASVDTKSNGVRFVIGARLEGHRVH